MPKISKEKLDKIRAEKDSKIIPKNSAVDIKKAAESINKSIENLQKDIAKLSKDAGSSNAMKEISSDLRENDKILLSILKALESIKNFAPAPVTWTHKVNRDTLNDDIISITSTSTASK